MKHSFLLAATAVAALLLSACSSSVERRIERNPEAYAALTGAQKDAVHKGQLLRGMNKDAVYLSWGRPNGIREGASGGAKLEKWRYVSQQPVWNNQVGIGYGYGSGRYGRYCGPYYDIGPSVYYVPYTSAIVEFRNGKVSKWERER